MATGYCPKEQAALAAMALLDAYANLLESRVTRWNREEYERKGYFKVCDDMIAAVDAML